MEFHSFYYITLQKETFPYCNDSLYHRRLGSALTTHPISSSIQSISSRYAYWHLGCSSRLSFSCCIQCSNKVPPSSGSLLEYLSKQCPISRISSRHHRTGWPTLHNQLILLSINLSKETWGPTLASSAWFSLFVTPLVSSTLDDTLLRTPVWLYQWHECLPLSHYVVPISRWITLSSIIGSPKYVHEDLLLTKQNLPKPLSLLNPWTLANSYTQWLCPRVKLANLSSIEVMVLKNIILFNTWTLKL